jgi:hypothetical protein
MSMTFCRPLLALYHGTFNVVAVRALITVLAGDEWDKAVSNLVPLLSIIPSRTLLLNAEMVANNTYEVGIEPGGYLQWIDPSMTAGESKPLQSQASAEEVPSHGHDGVNQWANLPGMTLDGCKRLRESLMFGLIYHQS